MADDTQIDLLDSRGNGLFVSCDWENDRFVHTVGIIADTTRIPLLRSREGLPDETWPSSPPLQQVSKQLVDQSPALLGLGMAGKSHYSTSFLLSDPSEKNELQLIVESACSINDDVRKNQAEEISLSSSYTLLPGIESSHGTSDTIQVRQSSASDLPGISLEVLRGTLSHQADGGTVGNKLAANSLVIAPADCLQEKTTQWSYRLQLTVNDVSTNL